MVQRSFKEPRVYSGHISQAEPQGSTRFLINVSSTLTFDDRYKEDKIEEFYLLKGLIDHLLSVT